MGKIGVILALALLVIPAEAQVVVTGALSTGGAANPVALGRKAEPARCRRRDRNPYFAARPVYPPAERGARANVTYAPFTSKYYPTEDSYYPPLPVIPSSRIR